jgi:prophage DNA circulation protein
MQYLKASYKGVPFYIPDETKTSGTRTAEHVYPGTDRSDKEKMGLVDHSFVISNAYLLGDKVEDQRDKFERALEDGQNGFLVSPWRGPIYCSVDRYTAHTDIKDFGVIYYTINFNREETDQLAPIVRDTRKELREARSVFTGQAKADFVRNYSLLDKAKAQFDAVKNVVEECLEVVSRVRQAAVSTAVVRRRLENVKGKIVELSLTPDILVNAFDDLISLGTEIATGEFFVIDDGRSQLYEQRSLMSESKRIQEENINNDSAVQIATLVYYLSLASFSVLIGETDFDTTNEADENVQFVFSEINSFSSNLISDDLFSAVRNLRQAVYFDLNQRFLSLPTNKTVILSQQQTSLELCYSFNGDLDYEETILRANNVDHPLFIPAAVELSVKTK